MRVLAAGLVLAALAGCSVALEGAACKADDNCPSGQKCGFDGKCSAAAAACPGSQIANYPPPPSLDCRSQDQYCGGDGTIVSCAADAPGSVCSHFAPDGGQACPPGEVCDLGTSGPICRPRYYVGLAIVAPAAGALVGKAGVSVSATLTLSSAAAPVPATVALQAQGMTVALGSPTQSGLAVTYSGSFVPASADQAVDLVAVAAAGTIDEVASPAVAVQVDTVPPVISSVTLSCGPPCLRDGTIGVSATVSDSHPGTATAAFPALSASPVALSGSGSVYTGSLSVRSVSSFPYFSLSVSAQVTATDALGNSSTATSASPVTVTRLRWSTPVETSSTPALTGAAVDGSGNAYLAGANGTLYVLAPAGTVTSRWPVPATPTKGIAAAPSLGSVSGATSVWVSSQDGNVYIVGTAGATAGTLLNSPGCATGGSVDATPAVLSTAGSDTGFVGSESGVFFTVTTTTCRNLGLGGSGEGIAAATVLDRSANAYVASTKGNLWSVYLNGTGFPTTRWGPLSVGSSVKMPLSLDSVGALLWSASVEPSAGGKLYSTGATTAVPAPTLVGTFGALSDAIVLSNEDVVFGDGAVVRRLSSSGAAQWTTPPSLDGAAISAMAFANGDAALVVPSAAGTMYALKGDGTVLWQAPLTGGQALREGNVYKLPGDAQSTAVFGGADGKVYAVIVDGDLDASAPWPRAHHDSRNTGNASSPLP